MPKPIPDGYRSVTRSLMFRDSQKAKDPFGYCWMVATHTPDLTDDEIKKGSIAFFAQMAKK